MRTARPVVVVPPPEILGVFTEQRVNHRFHPFNLGLRCEVPVWSPVLRTAIVAAMIRMDENHRPSLRVSLRDFHVVQEPALPIFLDNAFKTSTSTVATKS